MDSPPLLRRLLLALIALAVILPIAISIVAGVGALLGAMGDAIGGRVLGWIALAGGIVWVIVLVGLVLFQAVLVFNDRDRPKP
jgi:hypothetical protein